MPAVSPLAVGAAVLLLLLGVFAAVTISARVARRRRLQALIRSWGKPPGHQRDVAPFDTGAARAVLASHGPTLDEGTWSDLGLDALYAQLDRTHCSPGALMLYRMLRHPVRDAELLTAREQLMGQLGEDRAGRDLLRLHLEELGHPRHPSGLLDVVWGQLPPTPLHARWAPLLATGALASLALAVAVGGAAWLGVLGAFALNQGVHYRSRKEMEQALPAVRYLSRTLATAARIARDEDVGLPEVRARLAQATRELTPVSRATTGLIAERGAAFDLGEMAIQYVSIFFLVELRAYDKTRRAILAHRAQLQDLVRQLGSLDALQAVVSWRSTQPAWVAPDLCVGAEALAFEGLIHPLLTAPVANDLAIARPGVVLTGSNMAGKSTFLRAIAVNAVLARTLHTCTAKAFRLPMIDVIASLAPQDDLLRGRSFYFAEAERLLEMIRKADQGRPVLCVIDELLRGTNSVERLAASEAILRHLGSLGAWVVCATHDLELAERLEQDYACFHFVDHVDESGLQFDYLLRQGRSRTRNAIRLLTHLGYPDSVVEQALALAASD